ncbi:putative RDF protein [Mycobacterium phage 40AC]|uniref:Putative RDF protein n=1 Tax=Mycobacterium phage 40AC TaxID=1458717 RepID=W8EGF6_9CAUD|nr:site-specific recombination directionality factor RDF [Mycobacterium phage 40AC]AHJ86441.1 putative RDF protein [Mycobacterium phage 40AC]
MIRRTLLSSALLALLATASIQVGPAPAHAVTPECWAHLAGVDKANTPAADRRYHLERGQHSPCTEQDANEGSRPADSARQGDDKPDEGKSRFCRKRWYC